MHAIIPQLKNLTTAALMALPLCVVSGCGSYWRNRAADAGDIVTVAGGIGAGATVHAGPLTNGIGFVHDTVGIRNGFWLNPWNQNRPESATIQYILFGTDESGVVCHNNVRKSYAAINYFVVPLQTPHLHSRDVALPWTYYTNFEVGLGLGLSARVGFNPGELVDFLVGWFGVDLANDDLPRSEATPAPKPPAPRPVNPKTAGTARAAASAL